MSNSASIIAARNKEMKMMKPYGDLEDAKNVLDQFAKYLRVRVRFLDLLTEGLPPDATNIGDRLTAQEADGRFQRACELEEADVEAMAEMMNDGDGLRRAVLWAGKKMGVTVTGMRRLTATLDESLVPLMGHRARSG